MWRTWGSETMRGRFAENVGSITERSTPSTGAISRPPRRCDPDLEFISYLMQVEGGTLPGHRRRSWWDGLFGVYPDFVAEIRTRETVET